MKPIKEHQTSDLHRRVWELRGEGKNSGQIAEILNEKLSRINLLYVRPLPLSSEEKTAIHFQERIFSKGLRGEKISMKDVIEATKTIPVQISIKKDLNTWFSKHGM